MRRPETCGPSTQSGGWRESHPPAPTDPYVSLSAHTALLNQPSERDRPPPVREQTGYTSRDRCPPRLGSFERSQPFVLLASPPQILMVLTKRPGVGETGQAAGYIESNDTDPPVSYTHLRAHETR